MMKTRVATILGILLAAATLQAQDVLVGWTTFDPNLGNPNRADDSTPDTVFAGVSGLLGTQVNAAAPAAGGGQYSAEAEGFSGNLTYGSAFSIPSADLDPGNSGIRLSRFGGNNNTRYVDISVQNNSGSSISVDGIHFDIQYLFGPVDTTVNVSHFSSVSDLNDAFGFRSLLSTTITTGDFLWKEFDVSTAAMADTELANGETASFRIFMGATDGVGMKVDNVAISTIPEPTTASLLGIAAAGLLLLRRKFRA